MDDIYVWCLFLQLISYLLSFVPYLLSMMFDVFLNIIIGEAEVDHFSIKEVIIISLFTFLFIFMLFKLWLIQNSVEFFLRFFVFLLVLFDASFHFVTLITILVLVSSLSFKFLSDFLFFFI